MFRDLVFALIISITIVGCGRSDIVKSYTTNLEEARQIKTGMVEHIEYEKYDDIAAADILLKPNVKIEIINTNKAISDFLYKKFGINAKPINHIDNLIEGKSYQFDLFVFDIGNSSMGVILSKPKLSEN